MNWLEKAGRVLLIVVIGIIVLRFGMLLAPRVGSLFASVSVPQMSDLIAIESSAMSVSQPGQANTGLFSFVPGEPADVLDSVRACQTDIQDSIQSISLGSLSLMLAMKPDSDAGLVVAYPSSQDKDKSVLLNIPSARKFRGLLHPEERLGLVPEHLQYPGARCIMLKGDPAQSLVGLFQTDDAVDAVGQFYSEALKRNHWAEIDLPQPGRFQAYHRENTALMLDISSKSGSEKKTLIGIILMSGPRVQTRR